ncbi:MAG: hypothetical protein QM692_06455 [Thermomicrobiales bacterium]
MSEGIAIVFGAIIALLGGVFAEILRSDLERKNAQQERRNESQREALRLVLDHLTLASAAAIDCRWAVAETGYDHSANTPEMIESFTAFDKEMDQVLKFVELVQTEDIRTKSKASIFAHAELLFPTSHEDASRRADKAALLHQIALRAIGRELRSL